MATILITIWYTAIAYGIQVYAQIPFESTMSIFILMSVLDTMRVE